MELGPDLRSFLVDDADPGFRAVALVELLGRTPDDPEVRAARDASRSAGWVKSILAEQLPEGQWASPGTAASELYRPKYVALNWRLHVLADLGLTRDEPAVAKAVALLLDKEGGNDGSFGGTSSEVCFTGNAVRSLTRFGYGADPRVRRALDWLVRTQKSDGGWHCWDGHSEGTLDCWEALSAFAVLPAAGRPPAVTRAIERGAAFYLDRALLHEGSMAYTPWRRLHYPVHYYYDVLVGLDTLTRLGYGRDGRLGEALDLLISKRNSDGTWNVDASHPDTEDPEYQPETPHYPFVLEAPGKPSRWVTLRALQVLERAGRPVSG